LAGKTLGEDHEPQHSFLRRVFSDKSITSSKDSGSRFSNQTRRNGAIKAIRLKRAMAFGPGARRPRDLASSPLLSRGADVPAFEKDQPFFLVGHPGGLEGHRQHMQFSQIPQRIRTGRGSAYDRGFL